MMKLTRLDTCSFPSDMRRRSSRTTSSIDLFSFAVASLLKMCRSFGSHDIHSILGYVTCLFSMVPYACVVLHASSFKRKTIHACCHWVPHWQNPSKDQDPWALWESNPLDLTCQVNSFTISELQLRVFQNCWSPGWDSNSRPLVPWKGLEDLNFYIKDINCLWVHCLMLSP